MSTAPNAAMRTNGVEQCLADLLESWDSNAQDDNYSKGQAAADLRAALAACANDRAGIRATPLPDFRIALKGYCKICDRGYPCATHLPPGDPSRK